MTTADLIPVLKALRADVGAAGVFADWFEERGDDDMAVWLRRSSTSVFHGDTLLRLMQKNGNDRTRRAIAEAVAVEAFDRLNLAADDSVQSDINQLIYHVVRLEHRDTPPPVMWDTIGVPDGCGGPMVFHVEDGPLRSTERVTDPFAVTFRTETIHPRKFGPTETACVMLDGLRLRVFAVVWHGRLSDGRVIMSRIRKEHLSAAPARMSA